LGNQLRAMGEPNLSRPGARERFVTRLRLLVLPSFDSGYAIRIDESAGGAAVSVVELNGRGGYEPGRVRKRTNSRLPATRMRALHRLIGQSGLASAPRHAPPPEPVQTPEGPMYVSSFDGTAFMFELVDRNGSRFVLRHQSELTPGLRALVDELQSLRPGRPDPADRRP
jgi:hypothetical protein